MRSYKWFLVLASILLFLGLVGYHGYRWATTYAERYLLAKIPTLLQEMGGEEVSLGEVHVSFNRVYLKDIHVSSKGTDFSVEEIEVSYTPLGLLRSGFNPARSPSIISLANPHLTFESLLFPSSKVISTTFDFSRLPTGIIEISEGQLTFVDPLKRGLAVLQGVEGRIDHRKAHKVEINLQGELVDAWAQRALVSPYPVLYRDVRVKGGRVTLQAKLWEDGLDKGWSGKLEVEDGWVRVTSPVGEIRKIHILLEGDNERLLVKEAKGSFEGGWIQVTGEVTRLAQPSLSLQVEAQGLEVAEWARWSKLRGYSVPKGIIGFKAELKGPLDDPLISGGLTSDHLVISGHRISDLRASFRLRDKTLFLGDLAGKVKGERLSGSGWVEFTSPSPTFSLDLRVEGNSLENLVSLPELEDLKAGGNLVLYLRGQGRKKVVGEGSFRLRQVEYRGIKLSQLKGEYSYREGAFRFVGGDGKSHLRGVLFWGTTPPTVSAELKLQDVPLDGFLSQVSSRLIGKGMGAKLSAKLALAGPLDRLKFQGRGTVLHPSNLKGDFKLGGEVLKADDAYGVEGEIWTEGLKVNGLPYTIRAMIAVDNSRLRVKNLSINDYLLAEGTVAFKRSGELAGRVEFVDADLSRLANLFYPLVGSPGVAGKLWGRVLLSGSMENPQLSGELRVDEGAYHGLNSLALVTAFSTDGGWVSLSRFELYAYGSPLMVARGAIGWSGDMRLWAQGEGVNAAHLSQLLSGKTNLGTGRLDYKLGLMGKVRSPRLKGWFSATKGRLLKVEFDRLESKLMADAHTVQILGFGLEKKGKYRVKVQGRLPIDLYRHAEPKGGEIDLTIRIEDDVLALLPCLTEQVTRATGQGEVMLHLGGTSQTPTLVEAKISFSRGEVVSKFMTDKITNLRGNIWKEPDSEFLHIEGVEGEIGGGHLKIYNQERVRFADWENAPLLWEKLGVNLGTLVVEMGRKGIKINIPGIMLSGQKGRVELTGRHKGESFCIAGPAQTARVRGTIKLQDCEFTYPVSKGKAGKEGDFLKAVDWDLRVIVGRNVWYRNELAYLRVAEGSFLDFTGSVAKGDFSVLGELRATQGTLVYLDREFEVEGIELKFDKYDPYPWVSCRAKATLPATEKQRPTEVYLTVYSIDPETGEKLNRARWNRVRLGLEADDPELETQEELLARMGFGKEHLDRLTQLIGGGVDLYLWRPMVRPLEIRLKRVLGLDMVQLRPSIARNLMSRKTALALYSDPYSGISLFRGSRVTLGQQLPSDLFLTYTGQIDSKDQGSGSSSLGIKHQLGLEFNLKPNTRLLLEYDYDLLFREQDRRIRFEHYFLF